MPAMKSVFNNNNKYGLYTTYLNFNLKNLILNQGCSHKCNNEIIQVDNNKSVHHHCP